MFVGNIAPRGRSKALFPGSPFPAPSRGRDARWQRSSGHGKAGTRGRRREGNGRWRRKDSGFVAGCVRGKQPCCGKSPRAMLVSPALAKSSSSRRAEGLAGRTRKHRHGHRCGHMDTDADTWAQMRTHGHEGIDYLFLLTPQKAYC